MNLQNTKLHFLNQENMLEKVSKTGISLHCHTQFSKESLDFIPFTRKTSGHQLFLEKGTH